MSKSKDKISLWKKPSGNILSHGKGLTKEEIKFLHSLKVGDRIIIWDNSQKNNNENYPSHNLCLYEEREKIVKKEKVNEKGKTKSLLA